MAGAQLTSRLLYPVLGPRRNIALGMLGVSASTGLMTLVGAQTSLWWMRLLMFCLGVAMGQVFVPAQAAAFATITPEATGRASTMFNVVRQLGGAVGVAVLTTSAESMTPPAPESCVTCDSSRTVPVISSRTISVSLRSISNAPFRRIDPIRDW